MMKALCFSLLCAVALLPGRAVALDVPALATQIIAEYREPGQFDVVTNKRDFDFEVTLYEQLKSGGYAFLGASYYMTRASYAADRSVRRLITPGVPRRISFTSGRMTSRRLEPGSRLVAMINVLKESDIEINYGTAVPVAIETIAHAGDPLHVEWLGGSYLEVPGL